MPIPSKYRKLGRPRLAAEGTRDRIRVVSGISNYAPVDGFGQRRAPVPLELVNRYRNAQYVCATTNATQVASQTKSLYATTRHGQKSPRLKTASWSEIERRRHERALLWNPLVAKRLSGVDKVDEVTESPILEIFHKPNPWINGSQLIELAQLYREIEGRDFWYWAEGLGGRPKEIWPLPSWMVYVQPDYVGTEVVQNYIFTGGGAQSILDRTRLLFGKELNLLDPYTGATSWLRANVELADIYDDQVSYRRSTLANRGRPDAMLVAREEGGEVTVDPDAIGRIQLEYEQSYAKSGAGRLWVPPGGMDLKPINWRPTDMGEIALSKSVLEDMARASKVPVELIGIGGASRANMDAALLWYARNAIRPKCVTLSEHWNAHFLPLWDQDEDGNSLERQFIAFDDPVTADRVQEREDAVAGIREGYFTRNEVRLTMGLQPLEGGDMLMVPSGYLPIDEAIKTKSPTDSSVIGDPALKRGDKHVDGKAVPAGGQKEPFAEEDDVGSNNGKKKALGSTPEGDDRHPFEDSGSVPSAHEILASALKTRRFTSRYVKNTLSGDDRYKLLHAIRLQGRAWFRAEAARALAEPKASKGLLGKAKERMEGFFQRGRAYLRELLLAGAMSVLGPGRLTDADVAEMDRTRKFHEEKLDAFARDVITYGTTESPESLITPDLGFTPDQFTARAELYGAAPWPSSVNLVRARAVGSRVFGLERRTHVGSDKPCEICVGEQDAGWVPIGTLRSIGDSPCLSQCHCHFAYRVDENNHEVWLAGRGPLDEFAFGATG